MLQTSQGWDQPSSTNKLRIVIVINMKTTANSGHFHNFYVICTEENFANRNGCDSMFCLLFMLSTDVDGKQILTRGRID